jgi:hypothetical protein
MLSGVLIAFGFSGLRTKLQLQGEPFYSGMGYTAILVAIPLYLVYITLLHTFDYEAFKITGSTGSLPGWYLPISRQYASISIAEVALTYLATAAFAASLRSARWFRKTSSRAYIIISIIACVLVVLYPLYKNQVAALGVFPLLIPAIPFIMPYLLGVNLLKRTGNLPAARTSTEENRAEATGPRRNLW